MNALLFIPWMIVVTVWLGWQGWQIVLIWRGMRDAMKLQHEMVSIFGVLATDRRLTEIEAALVREGVLAPREQRAPPAKH